MLYKFYQHHFRRHSETQSKKEPDNPDKQQKLEQKKEYLQKIHTMCDSVSDPIDKLYCNEICQKIRDAIYNTNRDDL
jgi:hypothetical protein